LYTQDITLEFVERLRGELRFESVDKLIEQIYIDIEQTREIIAQTKKTLV
jgi:riboflavin kinase/FMN adenylyltransferase